MTIIKPNRPVSGLNGFSEKNGLSKPTSVGLYPYIPRAKCRDCKVANAEVIVVVEMSSSDPRVGEFCNICADKFDAIGQGVPWRPGVQP